MQMSACFNFRTIESTLFNKSMVEKSWNVFYRKFHKKQFRIEQLITIFQYFRSYESKTDFLQPWTRQSEGDVRAKYLISFWGIVLDSLANTASSA